jgi:isocitrate dehydrogenase
MAVQSQDRELQSRFSPLARVLAENETKIIGELYGAQGRPMDIGGYYAPDSVLASKAMRPSVTFNAALAGFQ